MKPIDFLEHGGAGQHPFSITYTSVNAERVTEAIVDPRERHFQWVLWCLQVQHVPFGPPAIPSYDNRRFWIPEHKRRAVFEHWCAAWDLPPFGEARRLAYLVDHYRAALTSDLLTYAHQDLGALWRARKWQTLLDLIDRLPGHSHYAAAVANDPEHAEMVAEMIRNSKGPQEERSDQGMPLTSFTPEVAMLHKVLDAVRGVQHAVVAVQVGKKAGEPPKPEPRPKTLLQVTIERAEHDRKKAKHEKLAARILKHKRGDQPKPRPPVH